ncbi:MAG: septum formation initiator family protein [Acidobacteriales bacterium]|nr:septum formation initiator family protein [Terriglobales bacterium]
MDIRLKPFSAFRYLRTPQHGFDLLVERAPQAEAWAARARQRCHPVTAFVYGMRRRLATVAIAGLAAWLLVHVMFGANGMLVYRQKKTEYVQLQKQIDALQSENAGYTANIKGLKSDPAMIEKEAREQLHYARPGEVVYVPPAPPAIQPPSNKSARK